MCFICDMRKAMEEELKSKGMGMQGMQIPKPTTANAGKSEPKEEVPKIPQRDRPYFGITLSAVHDKELKEMEALKHSANQRMYPKYFKSVVNDTYIDVYRVHQLFNLNNEMLCHASKKLLLAGERTGEKSLRKDVIEARDTLKRYLELNP